MKRETLLFISLIFLILCANAQTVGIGTTTPSASAALDISSVTGGLLLPRMTSAQRNALTPVEGMMIYNTEFSKFQGYGLTAEIADQGGLSFDVAGAGVCGSRWQSFTQPSTGIMSSVKLAIVGYAGCLPATVTVKIRSGTGLVGAVLQTSSVIVPFAGINMYIVPLHTGVTAGSVYTIEFISPSTGCNPAHDNVEWMLSNSNTYPGGYCYNCTGLLTQDFAFTTYMGTFSWGNLF